MDHIKQPGKSTPGRKGPQERVAPGQRLLAASGASPLDPIYGIPIEDLNPDIARLGPGPEGTRCGSCANLYATRIPTRMHTLSDPDPGGLVPLPKTVAEEQTVYYCSLTGQAKRVTWPSCANFREAPPLYQQPGKSSQRIEREPGRPTGSGS